MSAPSKPSPWANYLKEFLMLFLAVSLGFWVENLRQEREDRETEQEFMSSLLEDLAEDSLKVAKALVQSQQKMEGFDSLIVRLNQPSYDDSTLRIIYYLNRRWSGYNPVVQFSERTLKELTSTGTHRLIRNREVASAISHYQEQIQMAQRQSSIGVTEFQIRTREVANRIYDARPSLGLTRETAHLLLNPDRKMPPLLGTREQFNEYMNWLTNLQSTVFYYKKGLEKTLPEIAALMQLLEKEYGLPHPQKAVAGSPG